VKERAEECRQDSQCSEKHRRAEKNHCGNWGFCYPQQQKVWGEDHRVPRKGGHQYGERPLTRPEQESKNGLSNAVNKGEAGFAERIALLRGLQDLKEEGLKKEAS